MHMNDDVTIVSGLPRTGTSLMMQMLHAGGIPALTDRARESDEDNPRGYFELEAVKRTGKDPSWLADAGGRVVKMVHLLLYDLPDDNAYRVVFMRRELVEVVRSQGVMLERRGTEGARLSDEQLIRAFEGQLAKVQRWLDEQPNFSVHYVNYNQLMTDPRPCVEAINAFLGGGLAVEPMLASIDPSLYRQRQGAEA
jgi:Sulfotransferase domain